MTFLITGGAGSVGRHLTLLLLEKGHRVRVLDKDLKGHIILIEKAA
jgi:nucleoside-diphosphate-sugar epimerase